jgi:hypothetical protein
MLVFIGLELRQLVWCIQVVKKVRRRIKKEKLEGLTREGRAGGDDIVGEGGEVDIREDKARTETKKVFRGKEVDQGMK